MFFTYRQNNTGGSFDFDEKAGISVTVIVEANTAEEADARAEGIGLYWNGCETGQDCPCCGDRWYSAYGKGSEFPAEYDEPLRPSDAGYFDTPKGKTIAVHYVDGRIEWFGAQR